jgi:hypothetical protein
MAGEIPPMIPGVARSVLWNIERHVQSLHLRPAPEIDVSGVDLDEEPVDETELSLL